MLGSGSSTGAIARNLRAKKLTRGLSPTPRDSSASSHLKRELRGMTKDEESRDLSGLRRPLRRPVEGRVARAGLPDAITRGNYQAPLVERCCPYRQPTKTRADGDPRAEFFCAFCRQRRLARSYFPESL